MKYIASALVICVAVSTSKANSQTFTTLVEFTGMSGAASGDSPRGTLALSGTTLYGMTPRGAVGIGNGNVFSVGIDGTNYRSLVSLTGTGGAASGSWSDGSLALSGSTLYGMTAYGGANGNGNIFSIGASGSSFQNLLSFTGTGGAASGKWPFDASLILSGTTLYGETKYGGANGDGNLFSVGADGTNFHNLLSFTGTSGAASGQYPSGSLTLIGTALYGMTEGSPASGGYGNIFGVGVDGTNYQDLLSFTGTGGSASGAYPLRDLTLSSITFFGMTSGGGAYGRGVVFSVGADGTNYHSLVSFTGSGAGAANGQDAWGSLTLIGTTLYGMTQQGGSYGDGNIFSVGIDGSEYQDLHDFTKGSDGAYPYGGLTLSGGTLFGMAAGGGIISAQDSGGYGTVFALALPTPTPEPGTLALVGAAAVALVSFRWRRSRRKDCALTLAICISLFTGRADSQTFRTLVQFNGTTGIFPIHGGLAVSGTTLFGATDEGGYGYGNVFSVGTDGSNFQNLAYFTGTSGTAKGEYPQATVTLSGTKLYGMTESDGANSYGSIYSIGMDGTNYQDLLSFTGTGGAASGDHAEGNLTVSGTTMYGMTYRGGTGGIGNLFSVGTNGLNYQNLVSFTGSSGSATGIYPVGTLILSGTTLFGGTSTGGANGKGNLFSVGTGGTNFHNLVSFTGTGGTATGADPVGMLILSGTTLYGATGYGGADNYGTIFSVGVDGTSFKNLLSFTSHAGAVIGQSPLGSLTLSGTTLYGMTNVGGANNSGSIFSVGTDGSGYQNLYSFTGGTDGSQPQGDLTLVNGTLFGMTSDAGEYNDGTLFALTLPTPTPEPCTLALVGAGAAALVSYRWRRKRARRHI
jgi:uncharacterized repeat protein (TIGR03803 family)